MAASDWLPLECLSRLLIFMAPHLPQVARTFFKIGHHQVTPNVGADIFSVGACPQCETRSGKQFSAQHRASRAA